jgi:hypothetical protein
MAIRGKIPLPNNEIRNIKVLNQNYANSYYAIACRTEVLMENIDIEDWINSAVYIDSCVNTKIQNIHFERHVINTDYTSVIKIQGYNADISGIHFQNGKIKFNNYAFLLEVITSCENLKLSNVKLEANRESGYNGTFYLYKNDNDSRDVVNIDNISYIANTAVLYPFDRTLTHKINYNRIPLKYSTPPTTGNAKYNKGDIIYNSNIVSNNAIGWVCVGAGYNGTPPATGAKGTTSYSQTVIVDTIGTLKTGDRVTIAGAVGSYEIQSISGTTLTMTQTVNGNVSGAVISYTNPDWKPFGFIGQSKMTSQADSTATDIATIKADFNSLLARLKNAGLM